MGWYKRHAEEFIRSEVWKDRDLRHVWSDLMDLAGCDPGDGKIRDLLTHQPLSVEAISGITGWPLDVLNEQLNRLKKMKNDDDKYMVVIDKEGYVTLCRWDFYQNEYRRQSGYRKGNNKGYKPSYSLGAGLNDTEYALYLRSLYKITEEQFNKEKIKMEAWLSLPRNSHRKMTRQFIVMWLNKCDFAINLTSGHTCMQYLHNQPFPCGKVATKKIGLNWLCDIHYEAKTTPNFGK